MNDTNLAASGNTESVEHPSNAGSSPAARTIQNTLISLFAEVSCFLICGSDWSEYSYLPANISSSRKLKADAGLRLLRRFLYAAAVMSATMGLVMLYVAMDTPPLREPDCSCLFATRDPMKQRLVAGWARLNYIVYLAGMARVARKREHCASDSGKEVIDKTANGAASKT